MSYLGRTSGSSDGELKAGEIRAHLLCHSRRVLKYARLGPGATEVLTKDSASAIASSSRFIVSLNKRVSSCVATSSSHALLGSVQAVGTHAGMVHVLSYTGQKLSSYRAHTASVMAICISDDGSEFIGTASFDGPSPDLSRQVSCRRQRDRQLTARYPFRFSQARSSSTLCSRRNGTRTTFAVRSGPSRSNPTSPSGRARRSSRAGWQARSA